MIGDGKTKLPAVLWIHSDCQFIPHVRDFACLKYDRVLVTWWWIEWHIFRRDRIV